MGYAAFRRRRIELEALVRSRGLATRDAVETTEDDDSMRIAFLATSLGFDVRHALDVELVMAEVQRRAIYGRRPLSTRSAHGWVPASFRRTRRTKRHDQQLFHRRPVGEPGLGGCALQQAGPLDKEFIHDPYLTMAVKTAYSTNAGAASVRLNDVEIWPRPWANHSFIDEEAVTSFFDYSILTNFGWPGFPAPNRLTVVPQQSTVDYLSVCDVIYHFTT